ncbi:McrC family protein [Stenotrophomonas maltophilia]|nr:McrC family protein [Stenotrophomonas maltophilia]
MAVLTVREYARVGVSQSDARQEGLDAAFLPQTSFDWLCGEFERLRSGGAPLMQREGARWLRLDQYVGVMECPDGTTLEVLPKHVEHADDAFAARRLLRRMLCTVLEIAPREGSPADVTLFNAPLNEWVMARFIAALDELLKRGLRFDYTRVREEQLFLRGRLNTSRQLRQAPTRAHVFHIEHDVFSEDRPENRLLRLALDRVCERTRNAGTWRLAQELSTRIASVPRSNHVSGDLHAWSSDRLMAHYREVRPLCELVLSGQSPLALAGNWQSPSMMFPMEKLFERYVGACLVRQFGRDWRVVSAASEYLCRHRGANWFNLIPDFLLRRAGELRVLDTKWKVLDAMAGDPRRKYGLKQSDFYQMFAYGERYLSGTGEMALVYPRHARFERPLPVFDFSESLRLWVLPFDLDRGALEVPEGWSLDREPARVGQVTSCPSSTDISCASLRSSRKG